MRGYSPLEAGVRVIPAAFGLMVAAPTSARLTARFGTKRSVAAGMTVAAAALALFSTASPSSGYGLVAAALVILGLGTGTAMAPATDSIMGSLPLAKAGVGSAMNDTTRLVGGALGVAVLGSLLSSAYRSAMAGAVQALPPPAAGVAKDSVGGAVAVAQRVGGPAGEALAAAARTSFIDAMDRAVLIAAGIALLFLPARPRDRADALPVLPLGGTAGMVSARCCAEMTLAAACCRWALVAAPGGQECPCRAPASDDPIHPPVGGRRGRDPR